MDVERASRRLTTTQKKKKKARSELAMSRSNEFVNCDCLPFASVPGSPYRRLYVVVDAHIGVVTFTPPFRFVSLTVFEPKPA